MEKTVIAITEDEFNREYNPLKNHLDENASWEGLSYEVLGEERQYCLDLSKKENRVWSIIECGVYDPDEEEEEDDEEEEEIYEPTCLYIVSGFHPANAVGFFVTEKEYDEEFEIEIKLIR